MRYTDSTGVSANEEAFQKLQSTGTPSQSTGRANEGPGKGGPGGDQVQSAFALTGYSSTDAMLDSWIQLKK
ncbi:MAG: hypothetical protein LBP35_06045 [Candidatus Ancillula trichonymphae]|nr:hypothetical protein [Candidatus Ancillula trichonymphae]